MDAAFRLRRYFNAIRKPKGMEKAASETSGALGCGNLECRKSMIVSYASET